MTLGLTVFGNFGTWNMNEIGQGLQKLYLFHELCVTNTFSTNPHHRVSWRDLRSGLWHSLVGGKVLLQPKQIHCHIQKGRHYVNAARTSVPDLCKLSVMLSPLSRCSKSVPRLMHIRNEYLSVSRYIT